MNNLTPAVLISIRPQWCEKIANGEKTIEVRKTRPQIPTPFKCYVYCTQDKEHTLFKDWIDPPFVVKEYNIMNGRGVKNVFADQRPWGNANGKVIGEFVCDEILDIRRRGIDNNFDYCYESLNIFGNDDIEPYITAIRKSRVSKAELNEYVENAPQLYGWHISGLQIYERPMELGEFGLSRPPQSWLYIANASKDEGGSK